MLAVVLDDAVNVEEGSLIRDGVVVHTDGDALTREGDIGVDRVVSAADGDATVIVHTEVDGETIGAGSVDDVSGGDSDISRTEDHAAKGLGSTQGHDNRVHRSAEVSKEKHV